MEQFKAEQNPGSTPASREELNALGIPENVSMTRAELEQHLETKKRTALHEHIEGEKAVESLAEKMAQELTHEEIDRAEEAGKKRTEMGR